MELLELLDPSADLTTDGADDLVASFVDGCLAREDSLSVDDADVDEERRVDSEAESREEFDREEASDDEFFFSDDERRVDCEPESREELDSDDRSDDESFFPDDERRVDCEPESREELDPDDRSDDELFELECPVSANATPGVEAKAIPTPNATERALNWPTYTSLAVRLVFAFLVTRTCAESEDGRYEHSDSTMASLGPTCFCRWAPPKTADDLARSPGENSCADICSPPKEFGAFAQRFR